MSKHTEKPIDNTVKVPITAATTPQAGMCMVRLNAWWVVTANNEILYHKPSGSCQCNDKEKVAGSLRDRLYPDCSIQQLPVVFTPIKANEFEYRPRA